MRSEDGSIIHECLNGESEAFGLLVDKYKEGIYAFVYGKLRDFHDAQDVTQEVFLQAYRDLRSLRRWESFVFWLYRIASTRCKLWTRSQSRRVDQDFIEDQSPKAIDNLSVDSYRKDQLSESLREALDSLPEIYREVLMLYYFGGMSIKDIARAVGASPTAIGKRLSRARSQLKEEMVSMTGTAFEGQRLPTGFTFRIVEAVKRIKIHPMPRMTGLPWGLSLAAGIIVAVLGINPHLNIPGLLSFPASSPRPIEAKVLKTGEIPVDMLEISQMSVIANMQGDDGVKVAHIAETRASSNEGRIVFVSCDKDSETGSIWIIDVDGRNEKQLTFGDDWFPKWSPDGKQIAFYSSDEVDNGDIWVMNADGSDMKQLTGGPTHDIRLTWSPDGKRIAFAREEKVLKDGREKWRGDIYVVDVDGSNLERLTENGPSAYSRNPDWSPDGSRIVFCHWFEGKALPVDDIRVMDVNGNNQHVLVDWGELPKWSPDGKRIVFQSSRDGWAKWKSWDVYVMDADGANVEILTEPGLSNEKNPLWSPDGTKIVFNSGQDGESKTYIMDADGLNVRQLNVPSCADWTAYAVEPADKLPTMWGKIKSG